MKRLITFVSIFLLLSTPTLCGEPNPLPASNANANVAGRVSLLSNYEFWLTMSVLIFGCITLFFSTSVLTRTGRRNSDDIIKIVAVNLIVIGTLVTITAGMSDKQIAPAFGLFGAIAGYLFAKSEERKMDPEKKDGGSS